MLPVHPRCEPLAKSCACRGRCVAGLCRGVRARQASEGQSEVNETFSLSPQSSFRWFVSLSSKHRADCVFSSPCNMGLSQKEVSQSACLLTPLLGRQKTWLTPSALVFLAITKFLPMGCCCSRVWVGKIEERWGREGEKGEREGEKGGRMPWRRALQSVFATGPPGWCPLCGWPGREALHFTYSPVTPSFVKAKSCLLLISVL